jgi:hypothetical protein
MQSSSYCIATISDSTLNSAKPMVPITDQQLHADTFDPMNLLEKTRHFLHQHIVSFKSKDD